VLADRDVGCDGNLGSGVAGRVGVLGAAGCGGPVTGCGVGAKRSDGRLPPHVVAYLTMALCLFAEDDYGEVATKVTGALTRFGCWDASWSVPTSSGISQARKRLGTPVMAEIFESVVQPVGTADTGGRGCGGGGSSQSTASTWMCRTRPATPPSSAMPVRGQPVGVARR
jgi:hypothetical protein